MAAALAGTCAATTIAYAQFAPGSEGDRVLFEADQVTRETKDSPIVAEGNVEAYFGDRFLTSDRVVFDPVTDIVTAYGNVSITDGEGQTFFADDVVLTGDLADGIATNFSAMLVDDARLVSASVIKEGDERNILQRAVYTGCEVCKDNGDPKTPTWQVKAVKVVQDKEDEVIRFENAVFEVLGVPVLYTPYMHIPDPSVDRKSGFLAPAFGSTTTQGFYFEQPYYYVISDYQDLTFSPKFMEDQGVLLQGEYRLRTHDGGMVVQAGIVDANEDSEFFVTGRPGQNTPGARFHLFGAGYQNFNRNWRTTFDVNHVSDNRYLSVYDISRHGDLEDNTELFRPDRLKSDLRLQRRTDSSLLTMETIGFKSLRALDDNDYVAHALPRLSYHGIFDTPMIGGNTTVNADVLSLTRPDGLASSHAILAAGWERTFTSRGGHRFRAFGELRGDLYSYQDLTAGDETCNPSRLPPAAFNACIATFPGAGIEDSTSTSRFLPTAGVEWSYPLAKQTTRATYIVEPKIQLIASPEQDYVDEIVNEDSQFFEFDTDTLFRENKSSGYDLWEDGQRANVGISASALFDNGLEINGMVGQQFRSEESSVYSAYGLQTGLGDTTSDIVTSLDISWRNYLDFNNSFRFDREDGSVRRAQSEILGRYAGFIGTATYLKVQQRTFDNIPDNDTEDEFLNAKLRYDFTQNWGVQGRIIRDIAAGETTQEALALIYSDDCTRVMVEFRNDPRRDLDFDFNRSLTIKIELTGFAD